ARGRRRASCASRAGVGRVCRCSEDPCAPTDTCRHRNGSGGCRRPYRIGRFSGPLLVRRRTLRLACRALPSNSVVIAESTRRLVGNLFELDDLGAKNLKGVEGPVRAWAALRTSSVEGRFEALHAGGLTESIAQRRRDDFCATRHFCSLIAVPICATSL